MTEEERKAIRIEVLNDLVDILEYAARDSAWGDHGAGMESARTAAVIADAAKARLQQLEGRGGQEEQRGESNGGGGKK